MTFFGHEGDTQPWIRGVNIGGWLVLERFITPYFFALTDCHIRGDFRFYPNQIDAPPSSSPLYKKMDDNCKPLDTYPVDEWTLTSAFPNKDMTKEYMEIHWENFVTRNDIRQIARTAKATHIRVPLGHWIMGDILGDEPWVDGGWKYFERLVGWCREEGLEVWPDVHTAPGSQNGFDNSGHLLPSPTCNGWDEISPNDPANNSESIFSKNVVRSLKVINDISNAIARNNMTDVVTGFGVLNEPFVDCNMTVVRKFYDKALSIVRNNMGEVTSVYIGDMFNATKWNDGWWVDKAHHHDTYLDSHYYHVFDEHPRHLSPRQHIALVCEKNHRDTDDCCYKDEEKKEIPSKGIKRLIGEWSASFDTLVCDKLDQVMAGIAVNGTAPEFNRQISPDRQDFLKHFVEAQMVVFEASKGISAGWFYWTFKMEGGAFAEWDFLRGIKEGWIPPIPPKNVSSLSLYGTCYDIIFETKDNSSIVHEFPDPSSLNPNNWQGFPIDDDVVVSHGASLIQEPDGTWVSKQDILDDSNAKKMFLMKNSMAECSFLLLGILVCIFVYKVKKAKKEDYMELKN